MSSPLITASHVGVSFGQRQVLTDVSLTLSAGEIVTLVGPNGAGKSTLLRILLGLMSPTSGQVHRARGAVIGYTPQKLPVDPILPMRVERFLRLAGRFTQAQIMSTLADVGVAGLLNQGIANLSGGEWQRVLLARALLRSPDLLILDEPTQGVDLIGQTELYRCISRIREQRGCGVLLVSHDLNVVMAQTDRVVCLHHHICCEGQPQAVSQDPAFTKLFGAQVGRQFALYTHHHNHAHDVRGDVKGEDSKDA